MRNRKYKGKNYWDRNYVEYWKERTRLDSKDKLLKNDFTPPDIMLFKKYYQKSLGLFRERPRRILDVGIGHGRFIPVYKGNFINNIWGTDISTEAINECKRINSDIKNNLKVGPAEKQPFPLHYFDLIICWAVFDATYQEKTLWEFQRLLRIGGVAMITGKNTNYIASDKKAIDAEIGARKKGHPNYFTDVSTLEKNIGQFGFAILKLFKFAKRGDFSKNKVAKEKVKTFYEYVMIIKKVKNVRRKKLNWRIAEKVSFTYSNQHA